MTTTTNDPMNMTPEELAAWASSYDVGDENGVGAGDGEMSYEEFELYWEAENPDVELDPIEMHKVYEAISGIDEEGDSDLSLEELTAFATTEGAQDVIVDDAIFSAMIFSL